jgi:hypothetical protein
MKNAEPRLNLGLFVFATLLLDWLLGIFVLTGIEQVHVATDYQGLRDLTFTFPYSHSLVAALLWAALAGLGVGLLCRRNLQPWLAALVIGATVLSHWILDAIVHVPELPLDGTDSPRVGLSLYSAPGAEVTVEIALVVVGLLLYLRSAPGIGRTATAVLVGLLVLLSLFTVVGALATVPPDPTSAAITWLLEAPVLGAVAFWIDRPRASDISVVRKDFETT